MKWTLETTHGFSQDDLDRINLLREKLIAEYGVRGDTLEQFVNTVDDAITNSWGSPNLEEDVRRQLGK